MSPCQWIYLEATHLLIGKDKAAKEGGIKEGFKEG